MIGASPRHNRRAAFAPIRPQAGAARPSCSVGNDLASLRRGVTLPWLALLFRRRAVILCRGFSVFRHRALVYGLLLDVGAFIDRKAEARPARVLVAFIGV